MVPTIAMETYVRRNLNYLANMVDAQGQPYFNIFWTEPAQAVHDWPDFGDVMARQFQAAVMARHMTGLELEVEQIWLDKILSYLNPEDGLLYRPATSYSEHIADPGDQALTLYALVTRYLDDPQPTLRQVITRLVDGMAGRVETPTGPSAFLGGFGIKSLMVCARYLGYEPALQLAGRMVRHIFADAPLFSPDNTFRHGGHVHGNLRCLVGAADYALYVGDPVLYSRVDGLYRYMRGEATRFGFLPEQIGRQGDIILCETCALMDYAGLAVTLANHGHPEYWGDVERLARNHLIESQVNDLSWLKSDPGREDTHQITWHAIDERMLGGYAGWSSPNHILAVKETLNAHWGAGELRDKPRAFQNCCGGSGTHAYFIVWKNSARFQDGCLQVNLHLDKLLPQAEIRGYQPYRGELAIQLKDACQVKVRIPEFVSAAQIEVESDGVAIQGRVWGNYLELGQRRAGEAIRLKYPLPVITEEISIGNPGFRQYRYRVTWKGDTVIKMEPIGNDDPTGYSDYDHRQVPIFYGEEGPGPLYQRADWASEIHPQMASLQLDRSGLDFWLIQPSR